MFSTSLILLFSLFSERVFASLPQMERGVAKVIGGDPKGNNFLYTNGKCVIIRNIEVIKKKKVLKLYQHDADYFIHLYLQIYWLWQNLLNESNDHKMYSIKS